MKKPIMSATIHLLDWIEYAVLLVITFATVIAVGTELYMM